jgi:hypothetical protein
MLHRLLRTFPRRARRAVTILPVIGCIPGGGVWYLRFAFAFLAHLTQGGQVTDRLSGRIVGNPSGRPFNFDHLRGGPLFWAPHLVDSGHLFIGHTVCPGFNRISSKVPWWATTPFGARRYDYLHEGFDYGHVPVDLAPHAFVPVSVDAVDAAAWSKPRQRAVFVHGDPLEQAAIYFGFCRDDTRPPYNRLDGVRVADWSFDDYLFRHALPSYAKVFVSYQAMADAVPGSVRIMAHSAPFERPAETLASMLLHLTGKEQPGTMIADAVALARREHIAALEVELGGRLDGKRLRNARPDEAALRRTKDDGLRREALAFLAARGIDASRFPSSSADITATAA